MQRNAIETTANIQKQLFYMASDKINYNVEFSIPKIYSTIV